MSRKGKAPITLPKGVEVKVENNTVTVKGPKGTLSQEVMDCIVVTCEDNQVVVSVKEGIEGKSNFHGLYRTLIDNMVIGTTAGFQKRLEMIGVGYRAAVQGQFLDLQVGKSHPTKLSIPQDLQIEVEKNTKIVVSGSCKQRVGQFAAEIRSKRPPEVYQGKGIRYQGEYVRKKAGKAGKK